MTTTFVDYVLDSNSTTNNNNNNNNTTSKPTKSGSSSSLTSSINNNNVTQLQPQQKKVQVTVGYVVMRDCLMVLLLTTPISEYALLHLLQDLFAFISFVFGAIGMRILL
jgi:hypothetical protein